MLAAAALVGVVALFAGAEVTNTQPIFLGHIEALPTANLEPVVREVGLSENILVRHLPVDEQGVVAGEQIGKSNRWDISLFPLQNLPARQHGLGGIDVVAEVPERRIARIRKEEATALDTRLVGWGLTGVSELDFHLDGARAVKVANHPSNNPDVGAKLKLGGLAGVSDGLLGGPPQETSRYREHQSKNGDPAIRMEPEECFLRLFLGGLAGQYVGLAISLQGKRRLGWGLWLLSLGSAVWGLAWGIWSAVR